MLPEHLNFCTSISGPRPALINGPHLSRHHVACRPCPARQLCFRIMGALHPSPYHAMIVHLCDLSVKPLCQKGQQGTVQVEAIRTGGQQCSIYLQYATECLWLWLAVLPDKHRSIFSQTMPCLSFCCTWEHEALETFTLPSITLAGKAKPLMVTAGSIHVWSLCCFSDILNKMIWCTSTQIHRLMNTRGGWGVHFQLDRNIQQSDRHVGLKVLCLGNTCFHQYSENN